MAKKEYISRFLMIVKRVRRNDYPSYEDLLSYIQRESEFMAEDFCINFSRRTLQRDIKEIRAIFGIEIIHSNKQKGYYIDSETSQNFNFNELMETYDVLQLFKTQEKTKDYLFFEQKQPKGTTYLNGILYAIEHRKQIKFLYEKYWETTIRKRIVKPFALKEINNRWYILAENETQQLRTFALDRILSFEVTQKTFLYPLSLDVEKLYEFNYGISLDQDKEPKKVIFKTDKIQAKYFKSLPLHHTQKIEKESDKEVEFSILVKLSSEFIYKILSCGDRITIVSPRELINELKDRINIMSEKYN